METNCLKTNTDVSNSRNKEPIAYCIRASLRHFVKIINEFSGEEEKRSLLEHLRVELSDGWCPPRCRSTLLRIVLLLVTYEFSFAKAYESYSSSRSSLLPARSNSSRPNVCQSGSLNTLRRAWLSCLPSYSGLLCIVSTQSASSGGHRCLFSAFLGTTGRDSLQAMNLRSPKYRIARLW